MKYFILLLLSSAPLFSANSFLDSFLSREDKRYHTFAKTLELLEERNCKILVETGTARDGDKECVGDGCSTLIFGKWAQMHEANFTSIDNNPEAIEIAKGFTESVQFITKNSVEALENFEEEIDFLYLDSYDFDSIHPLPSQIHHLKEIIAAYPKLSEKCVILIDDCGQAFGGKGRFVVAYLTMRGWECIENEYQILLTKNYPINSK